MNRADYYRHVRLMHETMRAMNDEGAYYEWIETMPDEPDKDDFLEFVDDKEAYADLIAEFWRILRKYASGGIYDPDPETESFIEDINRLENGVDIEIIK